MGQVSPPAHFPGPFLRAGKKECILAQSIL